MPSTPSMGMSRTRKNAYCSKSTRTESSRIELWQRKYLAKCARTPMPGWKHISKQAGLGRQKRSKG